jgi:hypothetical protein
MEAAGGVGGLSCANVRPKASVHKVAEMACIGGNHNDVSGSAESRRLGSKDDIYVEVGRWRSRASLPADLGPKLRGGPQCLVGKRHVPLRVNLHESVQTGNPSGFCPRSNSRRSS